MIRPNDYDNTQAFGDYIALPSGGYVCKIMKLEETTSSAGKPMLSISLDIAEGEYKDYYAASYKSDARAVKKWGCIVNQLCFDDDGKTSRGLKTFMTSVEESNPGFKIAWTDNTAAFGAQFKGKLVGGLFRREEYMNAMNLPRWSTKCYMFRGVETIRKGVEPPKDKPLAQTQTQTLPPAAQYIPQAYMTPVANEDTLPF